MDKAEIKNISGVIRAKAIEYGFDLIGIAPAEALTEHYERIKQWCEEGMNSSMDYLGRNIEKRINPDLLFPGTRSVIVAGLNYYTVKKQKGVDVPMISRYAYGANYHDVIIAKLNGIIDSIKTIYPEAGCKSFVDSAPLLEKAWARRAGLGWPGKHSVLINRHIGSFFFLGVILTDLNLENDRPHDEDLCGSCSLCIQACPTAAINKNRTIDTRKCIACLTIESKLPVDENIVPKLQRRIFGCDICQEVCPWNRHAKQHSVVEFEPSAEFLEMTAEEWNNLSREKFKRLFKKSAIGRKKYDVFMKNVTNVTKKDC